MGEGIFAIVIGLVFVVISILNFNGNVKMLHSYHTKNIKEEDVRAFGRLVGIGVFIVSMAIITLGALMIPSALLENEMYITISYFVSIPLFVIGIGIALFAIKKYNKTIF